MSIWKRKLSTLFPDLLQEYQDDNSYEVFLKLLRCCWFAYERDDEGELRKIDG